MAAMYKRTGWLLALLLSGCVTAPDRTAVDSRQPTRTSAPPTAQGIAPPAAQVAAPPTAQAAARPAVQVVAPPAAAPAAPPAVKRREISGITCEGVAFDARSHRLLVADQAGGPGSRWADAAAAMAACGGLAALNGGFFTPEGAPLGRVLGENGAAGNWNRTSALGSAVFVETAAAGMRIVRRERAPESARELLQAGPLLVEGGRNVPGLDASKARVRSLLLWDGGSRWWLGLTSPCTLAALGGALAEGSPADWQPQLALNLDGGRSSDLAVSAAVPGGPLLRRGWLNRPVRNFLVLVPRKSP